MKDWTPRPTPSLDYAGLQLTGEEGYVLSRIDGSTSMGQLSLLTGMTPERLRTIVERLQEGGAILRPAPAAGSTDESGAAPATAAPARSVGSGSRPPPTRQAARQGGLEEEAPEVGTAAEEEVPAEEESGAEEDREAAEVLAREAHNYRKIFETELHPLPRDERAHLALSAGEPALSAFCFDPDPVVIRSVLGNALAGLQHARLVAAHHHNATGLQVLVDHPEMLHDTQVQRMLLRNPQLPEMIFRKFMSNKRLIDLYRLLSRRELSERSRTATRMLLRQKFASGPAEERVDLLFITEGRVLPLLAGQPFDSKMIYLLCSRTYGSSLLISNLARFATTPATVLAHLLKQQPVQRQIQLRNLLLQHPHMPADVRRRLGRER